jgi:hypothetical protein
VRGLISLGLVLLILTAGLAPVAAAQGCDDCGEPKKEYRDSALAGAGCTVSVPCADDDAIAPSASPATETPVTAIPAGVAVTLGLAAVLGGALAVILSRRAVGRRLDHTSVNRLGQESRNGGEL